MTSIKANEWLCENARALEQYAGQCVLLKPGKGVSCQITPMDILVKESAKIKIKGRPFVFHVPSKEELGSPIPVLK